MGPPHRFLHEPVGTRRPFALRPGGVAPDYLDWLNMRILARLPTGLPILAKTALCAGALLAAGPAFADKIKNPTAVFAGLDKITGRIISFEAAVDETVQFGSLQLTARVCYSRPEYENPQTTTYLDVEEVNSDNQYKKIFSGWMFAASPGLNAIEHPIYDVWLTECKGGKDIIKTPPEQDLVEDIPPPEVANKQPPKPAVPLPRSNTPGATARNAPLRLPDATGAPPPAALAPRPAPQQRFFPTNSNPGRGGYDPAAGGSGR